MATTLLFEHLAPTASTNESVCVALIGSGGKTSTMLALAADLAHAGLSVLVTTTTKIWPPTGMTIVLGEGGTRSLLSERLAAGDLVVLAARASGEGKLHGVHPELVCALRDRAVARVILVEADGAASRSLKAHRAGEPVVPDCCSLVLVVAGMDAVGKAFSAEYVHRPEEYQRVTGLAIGEHIRARHVAQGLVVAAGLRPRSAGVIHVLNKVESVAIAEAAAGVIAELRGLQPDAKVMQTVRGRPITASGELGRWV